MGQGQTRDNKKEREANYWTLTQATANGGINDTWALNDGERIEIYDALEIPALIDDILSNTTGAITLYVNKLSLYALDMVDTLYKIGYRPIQGNPPIKKMHTGEYKYLISDELKVYNIVLCHNKRGVTFVDADNIINVTDTQKVIEAYCNYPTGNIHEDFSRAIYTAIRTLDLLVGTVKKPPITISGYSRRLWSNTNGYIDHRKMLLDANRVNLPCKETLEQYCRKSYHGGLNIIRPSAENKIIDYPGKVLDVNSLYPYIMRCKPLPYGAPHYGEGKPSDDIIRDANNGHLYLYVRIRAKICLKPGGVPCVQLPRRDTRRFLFKRGWLENSCYYNIHEDRYVGDLQEIELTLTQTDFAMMRKFYDVYDLVYVNYIWFTTTTSLFADYIDLLYPIKLHSETPAARYTAKMLLNALSGNMARLPEYDNAIIKVDEAGNISIDTRTSGGGISYVYIGSAITSYARAFLVNYAMQFGDRWLYSDTDSIHFWGDEIPATIHIGNKMGEFKVEHEFDKAVYYKYKEYGMIKDGKADLTLAGVPRGCVAMLEAWASNDDFVFADHDVINPYMVALTDRQKRALDALFAGEDTDTSPLEDMPCDILSNKLDKIRETLNAGGIEAVKQIDIPVMYRTRGEMWESQLNPQFINLYDHNFLSIQNSHRGN